MAGKRSRTKGALAGSEKYDWKQGGDDRLAILAERTHSGDLVPGGRTIFVSKELRTRTLITMGDLGLLTGSAHEEYKQLQEA